MEFAPHESCFVVFGKPVTGAVKTEKAGKQSKSL